MCLLMFTRDFVIATNSAGVHCKIMLTNRMKSLINIKDQVTKNIDTTKLTWFPRDRDLSFMFCNIFIFSVSRNATPTDTKIKLI